MEELLNRKQELKKEMKNIIYKIAQAELTEQKNDIPELEEQLKLKKEEYRKCLMQIELTQMLNRNNQTIERGKTR